MIGGCPDCGKSRENQTQNIPEQLPDEVCESVCIPDYFKGIKWDKQIFLNSHKDEYAVSSLERYAEILHVCTISLAVVTFQISLV